MKVDTRETGKQSTSITRVTVEGLFGRYDYALDFNPRLAILYGDNGTGKTTILRMIHNLLSPGAGRGHKTAVANTPFQDFRIEFSNGTTIRASRKKSIAGNFELFLSAPKKPSARAQFIVNDEGYIPSNGPYSDAQDALAASIRDETSLASYYLSDDRTLDSDFIEEEEESRVSIGRRVRYARDSVIRDMDEPIRNSQVSSAILRTTTWARQQALYGASEGSVSANTIYADVVKHLAEMPRSATTEGRSSTRQQLLHLIERTGNRSKDQSRFGLLPAVNTEDLVRYVPLVRAEDFPLVAGILKPYLDGTNARLDALESTHRILSFFVDTLNNKFFRGKSVSFHIKSGLRITTDDNEPLDAKLLSSGESQLLTLFCNILSARETPTIFVIDEPEISLNIKWQRALVDSLLGCAEDSEIQLILASHSIELLTAHREHVVALNAGRE
ncbi:AAA family ATPase [Streptomyces niveus]|uniref:AAA family ATPase n=1 Tax=Streptomyces niveus TaxID=193462 RepID=UPI0033A1D4CF